MSLEWNKVNGNHLKMISSHRLGNNCLGCYGMASCYDVTFNTPADQPLPSLFEFSSVEKIHLSPAAKKLESCVYRLTSINKST